MGRKFKIHQTHENAANSESVELNFDPSTEIFSGIIENFLKLKCLDVRGIKIAAQEDFEGLSQLETLTFNENKIESLQENLFSSLSKLKSLHLQQNQIKQLLKSIKFATSVP